MLVTSLRSKVQGLWLRLPESAHGMVIARAKRMVFLQPTTRAYTARTSTGFVPVDGTHDEQESPSPSGAVRVLSRGGFFIHRRTTEASSGKGIDSARGHHLHPSSRLLFGRSVSSLSASKVASPSQAGQPTKREVNRLHRRGRDEKSETECVEYLRPDPFGIDENIAGCWV